MKKRIGFYELSKLFVLIYILVHFSSCVSFSFKGYENDGRVYSKIEATLKNAYIHENYESKSGIFYIPNNDCNITSIYSENDFYKVIDIVILDFPDFILPEENIFNTEIILGNGFGNIIKLKNEYFFTCYGEEDYQIIFNKESYWEKFLSTNKIEIINRYNSIVTLEKGKIYNFESIYIFQFWQQIQKNHELLNSVNKYFNDDIEWNTTNFNNLTMFPIGSVPRDSWGYYYYIFTTYNFPYYSYKIIAGKDEDTYLIISQKDEPVAVILDKNKSLKLENTEQYYSFQEGSYEIDYYQFIQNKSVICRYTKNTMPIRLTNGKTIKKRIYETLIMDNKSPLYWNDRDSYQQLFHIKWDDSNYVSYYKYQNQTYIGRSWEDYIVMDKNGIPHRNPLNFFNPLTDEDVMRLHRSF